MMLTSALSVCDPDLRLNLLSNVVLTGGGSLTAGFADRLNFELSRLHASVSHCSMWLFDTESNTQAKLQAAGNTLERRYGAWLGGSILASLGTFQQLWISQEEWQVITSRLHYFNWD